MEKQIVITSRSPVTVPAQLRIGFSRPSPLTVHASPVGEIDLATADMLSSALLCVLREQAPAILDVDLAGVTFLDCSGISALVAVRNRAARTGRQVTVSKPQPNVRRILQMTGLLDAFTAPIERRSSHATGLITGLDMTLGARCRSKAPGHPVL